MKPAQPSMAPSARQCAVLLLDEILANKRPFDEAAARHAPLAALSERDRGFARLLVLTALRRLGQIDALLAGLLAAPLKGKSQHVQHCLRLGAVQLLWLDTPPHAAVHAMVETAAALGHEKMKGVVNAVLKRVANEGPGIVAQQDEAKLNLPGYFYQGWRKTYGEEAVKHIAQARLHEPPLDITVRSDAAGWAEKLGGTLLPTGSIRLTDAGRVDALAGYGEGAWWVQDAAAALPVRLLGEVAGKDVLDLCAAPGGKTLQLAALGAKVVAVDQSEKRLERLRENLARTKLAAGIIPADLMRWRPASPADAVLLDAPCSATGTLRRHPELVWHREASDITRLVEIQKKLLRRAAGWVKPGGVLVYCVCSLEPEEGPLQVEAFLASAPGWKREPAKGLPQGAASHKGELRTHPGQQALPGGWDGFYASRLVRTA